MESAKLDFLNIETLEDYKYTEFGRKKPYIDKKTQEKVFMNFRGIKNYLGIENNIDKVTEKGIKEEFRNFELEFDRQNVDFCLTKDLEDNPFNYNVIKNGKYISAFTL